MLLIGFTHYRSFHQLQKECLKQGMVSDSPVLTLAVFTWLIRFLCSSLTNTIILMCHRASIATWTKTNDLIKETYFRLHTKLCNSRKFLFLHVSGNLVTFCSTWNKARSLQSVKFDVIAKGMQDVFTKLTESTEFFKKNFQGESAGDQRQNTTVVQRNAFV